MLKLFYLLTLSCLLYTVFAEKVAFNQCSDNNICEVTEVRVTPCKEASSNKPCKIKQKTNATIELDYKANFIANTLTVQAYSAGGLIDLPLIGMDRNACKTTPCPTVLGEAATYISTIYLSPLFPPSYYTVKYRMWDPKNERNECCITIKIRLMH